MLVGNNSNIQDIQSNNLNLSNNLNQTQAPTNKIPIGNVYKSDTIEIIPKPTYPPQNPQPPIDNKTNFFNNPMVRIGGMMLGGGVLAGGIGYLIGSSLGAAGMGATIGATLGVLAPVGILAYALYKWKNG